MVGDGHPPRDAIHSTFARSAIASAGMTSDFCMIALTTSDHPSIYYENQKMGLNDIGTCKTRTAAFESTGWDPRSSAAKY